MWDVLSKSPAGGATEASPQSHRTGMMTNLPCRHPPPRLFFPGRVRELAKGEPDPSICFGFFFNSPFDYGASSGTLTARQGGEMLWSLTEPTFRSIINLGASSVRRRLREKSNKFDTDTWRLYPHRTSVIAALLESHTRIFTLSKWTMSALLLGSIAIFLW